MNPLRLFLGFLFLTFTLSPPVYADFGCKCIICLASPTSPFQFPECRSTIKKLYKRLYYGGSFPKCTMKKQDGINLKEGYEPFIPCDEAYGPGYTPHSTWVEKKEKDVKVTVCRKFIRMEKKYVMDDDRGGHYENVPIYSIKPYLKRPEPYFIEVHVEGEQQGKRFYYKKKK